MFVLGILTAETCALIIVGWMQSTPHVAGLGRGPRSRVATNINKLLNALLYLSIQRFYQKGNGLKFPETPQVICDFLDGWSFRILVQKYEFANVKGREITSSHESPNTHQTILRNPIKVRAHYVAQIWLLELDSNLSSQSSFGQARSNMASLHLQGMFFL